MMKQKVRGIMPRKRTKSESAATVGNSSGTASKKSRLEVNQVYGDSSDDEDNEIQQPQQRRGQNTNPPLDELLTVALLKEMETSTIKPSATIRSYDFNQLNIDGRSADELRAHYMQLRNMAFLNVRHLPFKEEIQLVRTFCHHRRPNKREKKLGADGVEKPKRPLTSYLRFTADFRAKYSKKHPEVGNRDLMKLAGEKWSGLDDGKKRPYIEAYNREMEQFRREHPESINGKKSTSGGDGGGGTKRKRKPSAPKNAFELFSEAKSSEYAEKYGLSGGELQQKLVGKFVKLSEKKRAKWQARADEAMQVYLVVLQEFEGGSQSKPKKSKQPTTSTPAADHSDSDDDPPPPPPPTLANSKSSSKKKGKESSNAVGNFFNTVNNKNAAAASTSTKSKSSKKSDVSTALYDEWLH